MTGVRLCQCVRLTHERACAADETEEAALGRKSPTFTARDQAKAEVLSNASEILRVHVNISH